jgi:hypothetical protein
MEVDRCRKAIRKNSWLTKAELIRGESRRVRRRERGKVECEKLQVWVKSTETQGQVQRRGCEVQGRKAN